MVRPGPAVHGQMPGELPSQVTPLLRDCPYPSRLVAVGELSGGPPRPCLPRLPRQRHLLRFRIGYDYSRVSTIRSSQRNMLSAREKPEVVRNYLEQECAEHRVVGPLDPAQFPFVHISRFGVIPKSTAGKWRLIVDMSDPDGASINDGICESVCSLTYVTVSDAVQSIMQLGQGALLLAKVDIKSAYSMSQSTRRTGG